MGSSDVRRVINFDSWVDAIADAVAEWSSVAQLLVFTPFQIAILCARQKCFELCLKLRESRGQKSARQGQTAFRLTGAGRVLRDGRLSSTDQGETKEEYVSDQTLLHILFL